MGNKAKAVLKAAAVIIILPILLGWFGSYTYSKLFEDKKPALSYEFHTLIQDKYKDLSIHDLTVKNSGKTNLTDLLVEFDFTEEVDIYRAEAPTGLQGNYCYIDSADTCFRYFAVGNWEPDESLRAIFISQANNRIERDSITSFFLKTANGKLDSQLVRAKPVPKKRSKSRWSSGIIVGLAVPLIVGLFALAGAIIYATKKGIKIYRPL
ncbi:MAG: hypothetical protein AMJ89_05300 [candidate division Zixibacteria bacterium SM23_73]|nr:MAG: hypothetical protein AMJ89_05300 [candidate division Zixibacteria bacterium SM23_73]